MFTGLVSHCVAVSSFQARRLGALLRCPNPWADRVEEPVRPGESIAVSGCCLTVVEPLGAELCFDLSAETLARTWFAELAPGRRLNLERSLRMGERLGGHLVSGHVDGTGEILAVSDSGDGGARLSVRVPAGFERYLVEKGSVTLEGVSLTVVEPRGARFDVALIPATLAATSLGVARAGQRVHLEADMLGKWIEQLIRTR